MSNESRNRLLQLLASLLISLVFWGGIELLSAEFSWRHLAGGSMLTTLFLYAMTVYHEEEERKRSENPPPPIKPDKERGDG